MRFLIITLIALLPLTSFAQEKGSYSANEINWMTIDEAQAAMKKEPRKIMMDVYTKWCGPCKLMMKNTFTNKKLVKYVNDHFYAVKFNAESPDAINFKGQDFTNPNYVEGQMGRNGVHTFATFLKIRAYPSIVYFDEDLNMLTTDVGYKTPKDVERFLKFFKEDQHKVENPQEAWNKYNVEFKSEFDPAPATAE